MQQSLPYRPFNPLSGYVNSTITPLADWLADEESIGRKSLIADGTESVLPLPELPGWHAVMARLREVWG